MGVRLPSGIINARAAAGALSPAVCDGTAVLERFRAVGMGTVASHHSIANVLFNLGTHSIACAGILLRAWNTSTAMGRHFSFTRSLRSPGYDFVFLGSFFTMGAI